MAIFNFSACYLRAFILPSIPIALWGDQVGFFNDGSKMVLGQLPYRDYFVIVPPGTDLVYALLIRCFALRMWIPNLLVAVLAAIVAALTTLIASRLLRGPIVLLPGLLLGGIAFQVSMEATHHWFSTAAVMAALLVLLGGSTMPRAAVAGALCGIAACFTQTRGAAVVAGFAVYLLLRPEKPPMGKRWWAGILALCGAATAVFSAVNAYFIRAASFSQWLFCVVVFPLRYYSAPAINNWRVILLDFGQHSYVVRWIAFPFLYAVAPLLCILLVLAARRWRDNDRSQDWPALFLIAVAGVAMLLSVVASPSIKRLATTSPPSLVLVAWLLAQPTKVGRIVKVALASASLAIAIAIPVRIQTRWHGSLDLPAGRTAFLDRALYEEYDWLLQNTRPNQYLFGLPPLYYAFHTLDPSAIEGLHASEYTRPEQVSALVEALEDHRVPLIVLRESHDLLRETRSPADHLGAFRSYLTENYHIVRSFPTGDDMWRRNEEKSGP